MVPASTGPKKPRLFDNSYLRFASLGLQMLGVIGFSAWVGNWLDHQLNLSFPAFLLSFVFLAFTGMMLQLYRTVNKD